MCSISTTCVAIDSDGYVRQTTDTLESCTSFVLVDAQQYSKFLEPVLSPSDIAYVFGWGFGAVVIIGYFGGYGVGIAKKLINKI